MRNAFVAIHGHFYQPPRENPWLDEIEREESASPFHDWNERITFECYRPNAYARIVDGRGRILDLFNNYSSLSFNVGPTLLSWLEQKEPRVYRKIIEADRESLKRLGHGNAIAQVYDHLIMPLANERDQETEVVWGIKFFEKHFKRRPEAMWLPETAVNSSVLRVLFRHGMRYLILSPFQALRTRSFTGGKWTDVSQGKIDTTQPYRCFLRDRSGKKSYSEYIDLFFYDGAISKEVAFGDLLKDGERFCLRLAQAYQPSKREPQLIHLSTDGETFGHHKVFGEMALAYALSRGIARQGLTLTNYGAFLEKSPPVWEVEIDEGPKGEGSSWSCCHGVGRWKEDCGCSTGGRPGWNQRWRAPLREALNLLRDDLAELYEEEGRKLFPDPWRARDGYIDLIMDRSPERIERFFEEYGHRDLDPKDWVRGIKLLEMQRHGLRMFTSCGWFFADLAGLETQLILQHAARAIDLATEFTDRPLEKRFLDLLSQGRSNVPGMGDGRQIYERLVKPRQVSLAQIVNHHAFASLSDGERRTRKIFSFHLETNREERWEKGETTLLLGQVTLRADRIPEPKSFLFLLISSNKSFGNTWVFEEGTGPDFDRLRQKGREALERGEGGPQWLFQSFPDHQAFTIGHVIKERSDEVFRPLIEKRVGDPSGIYEKIYRQAKPVLEVLTKEGIPIPYGIRLAAEFTLNQRLQQEILRLREDLRSGIGRGEVDRILKEANQSGCSLNQETPSNLLSQLLYEKMASLKKIGPSDLQDQEAMIEEILGLLSASSRWGFKLDLLMAQDLMGEILNETLRHLEESLWGFAAPMPIPSNLIPLAEALNFDTEKISKAAGLKR
ncbi:MAG: DUF3536 domain-containing protein [Desulfobacterota bacterium]|nr:DUF3536 domain-containing protein [Thermodesulfobacteriota bacterium]